MFGLPKSPIWTALGWVVVVIVICAVWHPLAEKLLKPLIDLISHIIPKIA